MKKIKLDIKIYKKKIAIYVVLFFIMLLLNRSAIIGLKVPFASALAFSLLPLNMNGFALALIYFTSSIIYGFSIDKIVIILTIVSSLLFLYLSYKICNKKVSFTMSIVSCIIGQAGYIYFHLNSSAEVVATFVVIIITVMFMYICLQTFNALLCRGLQSRFTLDESICFSIFLIAMFSGVANLYVWKINITNLIAIFILLVASKSIGNMMFIYLSALMGVGVGLALGNVTNIATYVTTAIAIMAFKDKNKLYSILSVIFLDLIFGYFFNVYAFYNYLNVISLVAVCIIYLCMPSRLFSKFHGYSYDYTGSLADEFLVTGQRELLKQKLMKTADLFNQIQSAYRNLSFGEMNREKASKVLAEEIMLKYCKKCSRYHNCMEQGNIKNSICQLFEFGLEKGKVTIIDANNLITTECKGLTGLINEVNNYVLDFFSYEKSVKDDNMNKMLIAEQFLGTSNIFKEFSNFIAGGEKINYKTSRVLKDELTINNIVVNEVMVIENENGVEKVILIVRNTDVVSENIAKSLKSVFRINLALEICKITRLAGWSLMCFSPAPRYEISVGFACSSQESNNVSGDNYSFLKLNNNRVLFAICDGMGHGERANEISSVALNLVEGFYQSGFSSDTIISSVNKILLPAGDDNFTTLDACVFNKNDATVDFIKMGSTCSVIKSQNTCKLVVQDSLPLGIMDNFNVHAKKCILQDKDIVVMASDGVVDSFSSFEEYLNYINNERVINVQMLASSILEEAESRNNVHNDDKTVIVFKVNAKV